MRFNLAVDKNVEAVIDKKLCINCGKCRHICPTGAIEEYQKTVYCMFPDCGEGKGRECAARYFKEAEAFAVRSACTSGCPLGIVPQAIAGLVKAGDTEEAFKMIEELNPMPDICGAVCAATCEESCKRGNMIDTSVDMRALENHVVSKHNMKPYKYIRKYDERIAVIGAGAAGLAAAYRLSCLGYEVTIFEKDKRPGGALKWGIPSFRLERERLFRDTDRITQAGVRMRYGCAVGEDAGIEDIWEEGFSACLIAVGASEGVIPEIPGSDSDMVYDGVKLLRQVNGGEDEGMNPGNDVIVIGGGPLAESAARILKREGRNVACVAMEPEDEIRIPTDRVRAMKEEGINLMTATRPKQIINEGGRVKAVEFIKVEHTEDGRGISRMYSVKGSEFNVFCDTVIFADERRCSVEKICNVETYPGGTVRTDAGGRTNKDMVFACGDAVMECGSVAEAMASGLEAAAAIDRALHDTGQPQKDHVVKNAPDTDIIYPAQVSDIIPQKECIAKEGGHSSGGFSCDIAALLKEAGIDESLPVFSEHDKREPSRRKVAVIGGGIAGITAATDLAKKGYAPVLFEKEPGLGGRYRWLSSDGKLDKHLLVKELDRLEKSGIEVICNINAGVNPDIKRLMGAGYEAVLFAIGETKGKMPDSIKGNCKGVFEIVSLLKRLAGDENADGIGNQIIVTGCDEMTFDVARVLRKRGSQVTVLSPIGKRSMRKEVSAIASALDEGVNLVTGVEMTGIRVEKGRLRGIDCRIKEKEMNMEVTCDTVVIGGTAVPDTYGISLMNPELEMSDSGYIEADDKLVTSMYGVFAIGNLEMSASEAGHAGAATVDSFMKSEEIKSVFRKKAYENDKADIPKYEIFEGTAAESGAFETGRRAFSDRQAFLEASRCMNCGYHMETKDMCMGCGICVTACPVSAVTLKRIEEVQS